MKFDQLLTKIKNNCTKDEFSSIVEGIKQLNGGQRNALHFAIDSLYNTNDSVCISGPAGSGKTFLTKVLLKLLESLYDSSKIVLAAPTHQAKKVLAQNSGKEAYTIHSLFRILPNLQEDRCEFTQQGKELPKLNDILFLIIDEVSMIDDELFRIIYQKLPMRAKIIALGDPYQLSPINSDSISKFFTHKDFAQIRLSEIMRQCQDSPIIFQANQIRNRLSSSLYNSNNSVSGIFGLSTEREFINEYLRYVKTPFDAINNRMIAYTNESVNELNRIIRKIIHKTDSDLVVGEYLVMQQALIKNDATVLSNGELIEVIDIEEKNQRFDFIESKDSMDVRYYKVTVKSIDTDEITDINIINNKDIDDFNFKAHCEASQLKNKKKKFPKYNLGFEWKQWWENKNFFSDVKPIFASTVHKIQGTTLENCFVYQKDFSRSSNNDNYYQLLYVAVTRAKNNIYFV